MDSSNFLSVSKDSFRIQANEQRTTKQVNSEHKIPPQAWTKNDPM